MPTQRPPRQMPRSLRALPSAPIVEGSLAPEPTPPAHLPYGLLPAEPRAPDYKIVDLGEFDSDWAGFKIVFDLDLEIGVEELGQIAQDQEGHTGLERSEAQFLFLEATLLAWNFTRRTPAGDVEALPQPREGGVRKLTISQTSALMRAFSAAYSPDPKA